MSARPHDEAAWTGLVRAVHDAPVATVLELAGGTQGLAWLHAVEGSSATVLEAHDRYHHDSLTTALGVTPSRATDPAVADALAAAARERARALAGGAAAVVGLGCTTAMVTGRARRGAHVSHVATRDGLGSRRATVQLTKGARTRAQEEAVAGRLVLLALANAAGVDLAALPPWPEPEPLQVSVDAGPELAALLGEGARAVCREVDGSVLADPPAARRSRVGALLSGAFNPVHDGHRGLAAAAAAFLGTSVAYELPVLNADKSPLDGAEAHRRAAQFLGRAELWLTRAALYADKAALFPGAVFVVGADTAERVLQPRFYGGERQMMDAVAAIGGAGCRFLVAARPLPSGLLTLGRLRVPEALRALFLELPADRFCLARSSTGIRDELSARIRGSGAV
ncbi:MAG: hypothetical protein OXC31_26225 [Spirochaetaceae bacterium]|nr:hypothetical protein [Spirochaetaceae bacterium]